MKMLFKATKSSLLNQACYLVSVEHLQVGQWYRFMSCVDFGDYLCFISVDCSVSARSSCVKRTRSHEILHDHYLISVMKTKSTDKLYQIFPRKDCCLFESAQLSESRPTRTKFLQISFVAAVHNQACHFPRNRRVVEITAFEEWKFTHWLSLKQAF